MGAVERWQRVGLATVGGRRRWERWLVSPMGTVATFELAQLGGYLVLAPVVLLVEVLHESILVGVS